MSDLTKEELLKLTPEQWEERFSDQRKQYNNATYGAVSAAIRNSLLTSGSKKQNSAFKWTTKKVAFAGATLIVLAAIGSITRKNDPRYASEYQAAPAVEVATVDPKQDLENKMISQCASGLQASAVVYPDIRIENGWINGDVNSDFVVIQPGTLKISNKNRVEVTAVCYGNNGRINKVEITK